MTTHRLSSRVLLVAILTLAAAICVVVPLSAAAAPPEDQYIVVLDEGVDAGRVADQHRDRHHAGVRRVFREVLNGYTARIGADQLGALRSDPRVAYVERDREISLSATQSGATWGLDRIDQPALPLNGTYIYTSTGAGVRVFIVDTGIRVDHEDFGGRVIGGYTAIGDGRGTADCHGHGTHVAGTVGGSAYGVAKGVTLVPVRVLDCEGSGSTSGVIAGVEWITGQTPRPAVANMSLGGGPSRALDTAVTNSIRSGVSYSLAAGNEGADACKSSPGRVLDALTIAATNSGDAKPWWSNFGDCVDWFAPGASVTSTYHWTKTATVTMSGTSMAAPHTAGAAALLLEASPGATPAQVREGLAAALTRGIVTGSSTTNNDLLFVGAATGFAASVSGAWDPAPTAPAPASSPAAPDPIGPAPIVARTLSPTSYRILAGTIHRRRGALSRLKHNDAHRLELSARRLRGTFVSALYVTRKLSAAQSSALKGLSVSVDGNVSAAGAMLGLQIYNWSRHRYETITVPRAGLLRDRTLTWTAAGAPGRYVSAAGEVRVAIRAAHSGPFRIRTDQVEFTVSN